MKSSRWIMYAGSVYLLVACGCTLSDGSPRNPTPDSRPRLLHRRGDMASAGTLGTVTLGGLVEIPQSIEIAATGTTLGQALAGAGRKQAHVDASMYVSLSRNVLGIQSIHHFPLRTVEQDYAGQIPLQDGDIVRIQSDTALGLDLPGPGFAPNSTISVATLGEQARSVALPDGKVDLMVGELGLVGLDPIRVGATFVVVTRPSSGGLTLNHFVLSVGQEEETLTYSIHPNDQIVLTQLQHMPLIQQGIREHVRRRREDAEVGNGRRITLKRSKPKPTWAIPGSNTVRKATLGIVQQAGRAIIGRLYR